MCTVTHYHLHNYIGAVKQVQASIDALERMFDKLKRKTIELLEVSRVEVKNVVYELSTLPANEIGQHKMFLKENLDKLRESKDNMALFGDLNLYWTYLSPDLLKHLVIKLPHLEGMKGDIEAYMIRLHEFRTQTPLDLFCQTDKKHSDPPEGFASIVARFKEVKPKLASEKLTLQDIEDFRQKYGNHYKLRDFAFLLRNEVQKDSFVVTFWVPESVIELLLQNSNIPQAMFIEYGVTQLHIGQVIVFNDNSSNDKSMVQQITTIDDNCSMEADVVKHASQLSYSEEKLVPKSSEGRNNDRGGYGCTFVTQPPDAFQTDCPVCLQILKEPCMISCPCGKKICRQCVEQIKRDNKPCPFCNKSEFTFLRDYGLERSPREQEVWCSKKKDGCEWRGKLGEYEQHLNEDSSPENQLTGCRFVEVECEHNCGGWFQRFHIATHQNKQCVKRPYSCEYCQEYDSTYEDVTENHYWQCHQFPVTCPNKCQQETFKQKDIEDHLKNKCPLTEVSCCYVYAGCEVRLPRKDMPGHMEDTFAHMSLLENEIKKLKKHNKQLEGKQKATCKKYQKHEHKAREEYQGLSEALDSQVVTEKLYQQLELKQKATEKQCQELKNKLKVAEDKTKDLKDELKRNLGELPIVFPVNKEKMLLPSFWYCGYRMCINVYTKGHGCGKGTHVSIYTHLMKGQFDDHLKWPFRGEITIQIVNQAGGHGHFEKSIVYNDKTPDNTASRVTEKERANGWGHHQFLPQTDLKYNAENNTQYLKDGIIIIRLVRVKITQ